MKVLKDFNNVSEKLREEKIKPLQAGEVKVFRMLHGVVNPDPDYDERQKQPVLYGARQIPTKDRIRDPYANGGKSKFVDIGVVEDFDITTEQPNKFRCFVPGQGIGQFLLSGDKVEDVELYEYLCLCKWNKANNTTNDALFEEIVKVSESEIAALQLNNVKKALAALESISDIQIQRVGSAMKWDVADMSALMPNIQTLAISNPEKFLQLLDEAKTKERKATGVQKQQQPVEA